MPDLPLYSLPYLALFVGEMPINKGQQHLLQLHVCQNFSVISLVCINDGSQVLYMHCKSHAADKYIRTKQVWFQWFYTGLERDITKKAILIGATRMIIVY